MDSGQHDVIRNVPLDTECSDIYRLVSSFIRAPANSISLSNGVKVLRNQEHTYEPP